MKLHRFISLVLALLGFATLNLSHVSLSMIRSTGAAVRYELSKRDVAQAVIDAASSRIREFDRAWTPVWWLGLLTTVFALVVFGLTFRPGRKNNPNQAGCDEHRVDAVTGS